MTVINDNEEPAVYLLAPFEPRIYGPVVANLLSQLPPYSEGKDDTFIGVWRRFVHHGIGRTIYPLAEFGIIPHLMNPPLAPFPKSAHIATPLMSATAAQILADDFLTELCINTIKSMPLSPIDTQFISVACLPGALIFIREPRAPGLAEDISDHDFKIQQASSYQVLLTDQKGGLDYLVLNNKIVGLVRSNIERLVDEAERRSDKDLTDHRGMCAYLTPKLR